MEHFRASKVGVRLWIAHYYLADSEASSPCSYRDSNCRNGNFKGQIVSNW